jgi:hypothetical protein
VTLIAGLPGVEVETEIGGGFVSIVAEDFGIDVIEN